MRLARTTLLALLVLAVVGLPALAIRASNAAPGPVAAVDAEGTEGGKGKADDREREGKGRPPWAGAGTGPPWAGAGKAGVDRPGKGSGPAWAREREGDGPPWGLAWGYWLVKGGADACERISARMNAHPGEVPPPDMRKKIKQQLGCNLGD